MSESSYQGCMFCAHNYRNGSCAAFYPAPIPLPIAAGELVHTMPIEGQSNGVIYQRTTATTMAEAIAQGQNALTIAERQPA